MRKLVFLILTVLLTVSLSAQTGELRILVKGINVDKGGTIRVGVYKEEGFPDVGNQVAYSIVNVSEDESAVLLKNIKPGTYAVAVFQDSNTDGELSKNMFGVPVEAYGFSRNIYGRGGPPAFGDVSFELESGKKVSLVINLK